MITSREYSELRGIATEIRQKVAGVGVPSVNVHRDDLSNNYIPDGKTIGLCPWFRPFMSAGLILRVQHHPKVLDIWYNVLDDDEVVEVGVIMDTTKVYINPILNPVPMTAQIIVKPLWDKLGISCRPCTPSEVYSHHEPVVARLESNGYLIVTHAVVDWYADQDGFVNTHSGVLSAYRHEAFRFQPTPPAFLSIPAVSAALARGETCILSLGKSLADHLAQGPWTVVSV